MSFGLKLLIIWGLAAAIAWIFVRQRSGASSGRAVSHVWVGTWVAVIAGALIIVGMVSQTLLIHSVQITPLLLVFVLLRWRPAWGTVAAVPLFVFWFLVMGGIWLFLLGIARVFSGTFSATEIVLTLIIGVASLAGVWVQARATAEVPLSARLVVVVVFSGLQSAALWISYQPIIAAR
jgi:hypothetical protein